MTIYISGPMTGLPGYNYPAFDDAAAKLRAAGYDVVNPAELCDPNMKWRECMRLNIAALMECDAIVMLPDWLHSRGACLELRLAYTVGIKPFFSIDEALGEQAHVPDSLSDSVEQSCST